MNLPSEDIGAGAAQILAEVLAKKIPAPGNAYRTLVSLANDLSPARRTLSSRRANDPRI